MGLLSHQTTPQWIIDCGATDIMTLDPRDLKSVKPTLPTYKQLMGSVFKSSKWDPLISHT